MPSAIGRYAVLRTIARGGMSVVYEVEDPQTRERFALKHLFVDGDVARSRFAREYGAMVRMIHPNIGRVFAQGEHDDYPWMTLEYLDGVPVTEHVEAHGAPGSQRRTYAAVQTMLALARALDHVHARRIVHRDIKSGNVLVLPDGRVKLVDFGIAWVPGSNQESEREEFVGTLAYAAPEQFRGETPTAASDLYSVGCLLYRLLTGTRPFTGSNAAEMAKLHTSRPPTRPRSLVATLPGDLERIVLRLMKKKPDARIPTARALADQLAEWIGTQPTQTASVKLDRGARRGIGREAELETLRQKIEQGSGGTVLTLRGLLGARHNALLDLLVADAQARQAPVLHITHKDSERFAQLQNAGRSQERTLVALVDVHQWDSGSSRALERSIEAAAENPNGAIYVASLALDASDLAIDILLERSSCDVVLGPLPLDGTRRLVGALLQRHAPPAASARSIHHATDGVPAYVEEVIGQMIAKGQLDDVRNGATTVAWPWRQQSEVPSPEGAAWTVDQALATVDAIGQRILEALAATHSPAPVDRLLALIDLAPPDRTSTLLRLVTTGLVRMDIHDGGQCLFWTRPLAAQLVRERTPGPRARTLARRALSSAVAYTPHEQVRMALTAKRIESALAPAHQQARVHLSQGAPASALELVEPVYAQLQDVQGMDRDQALVQLTFAAALHQLRPGDERIPKALAAVTRLTSAPELLAETALITARVHRALARNDDARQKLGEAWTHASSLTERQLAASVAYEAGTAYVDSGHIAWGKRWFDRCTAAASTSGDPRLTALSTVGQAIVQFHHGELDNAGTTAARAIEGMHHSGDVRALSLAVPLRVNTLRIQGQYSAALACIQRHQSTLQSAETPVFAVRMHVARAHVELDLGRLGWAQDSLEQAQAGLGGSDNLRAQLATGILQARVHIESGEPGRARSQLERLVHRARRAGLVLLARQAQTALAEALAQDGHPTESQSLFDTVLADTHGSGDAIGIIQTRCAQIRALHTLVNPESFAKALQGWPQLPGALGVQLDIARARLGWDRSQLLNADASRAQLEECLQSVCATLDPPERRAVRLPT